MDKKQGVPKTKVPIIGGTEKAKSEEFVRQIMQYLDPIMNNILQSIDGIERRIAVLEEISGATLVDTLWRKIRDKLDYPDAQPQGITKEKK